ncbi:MAG: DUF3618 domain-containing protein [Burkholderiales bacterium]|nr:MAG: DUF3618 domain-containing protein [Burkholderiales bacterium]
MTTETDKIEADINRSRHALNDTIEALGGKLTPGQIIDEAMGLFQGQAGQFTANLGRQVRDNPLPILLIAAGAALLFTNKGKSANSAASSGLSVEDWHADGRYSALEAARSSVIREDAEEESAWSHRLHEVEAKALGLKQDAGEAIDAFKDRVKSAAEALGKAASGVREKMTSGYSHAAHAITGGAAGVSHFAADQAEHVKHAAGDMKHKAQDFYSDNPLAAGALGVAIGALIGASAPLTSVERDGLEGVADAAKRKTAELAGRGARAAETLASKAVSAIH